MEIVSKLYTPAVHDIAFMNINYRTEFTCRAIDDRAATKDEIFIKTDLYQYMSLTSVNVYTAQPDTIVKGFRRVKLTITVEDYPR